MSKSSHLEPVFLPTKDPVSLKLSLRDTESFNQEIFERFRKLKQTLNISDGQDASMSQQPVQPIGPPAVDGLQARLQVLHGLTSALQNKLDKHSAM